MAYNTGNPVGSSDFRDLSDNAVNFDKYSVGPDPAYPNRRGELKLSIEGMNQAFSNAQDGRQAQFEAKLGAMGYTWLGDYGPGLNFTSRNQYMVRGGLAYTVANSTTLPYTTTGNWTTEVSKFKAISVDDILRADLAQTDGATLIGMSAGNLAQEVAGRINVLRYGANSASADNTAAFASADAAAFAAGVPIYVPGAFIVGNLNLRAPLTGDGKNSKLTRLAGTTGKWLTAAADGVLLAGIKFDGAWVAADALEVNGFADFTTYRCKFYQIGGLTAHFNGANNFSFIENNINNTTNGVTNVMPQNSTLEVQSTNYKINRNTIDTVAGSGIYLAGEQSSTDANYHFTHVLAYGGEVEGNTIKNVSGHGIIGQCHRTTFIGNRVFDTGNAPGLQSMVLQGEGITVIGNICEGGSGVGIDMGACSNATVIGNQVRGKGEIGIELQSCTNLTCCGNSVTGCGATVSGASSAGINVSNGFFGPTFSTFNVTVTGNTVTAGSTGGKYGISVTNGAKGAIVTGNTLVASGTTRSLFIETATGSDAVVFGNLENDGEESLFRLDGVDRKFATRDGDLWLSPGTGGSLRLDAFMTTAINPAAFVARARIKIKDRSGNAYWIPVDTVAF